MKSIFLSFLLASAAIVASAAGNPSFDGKWQVHSSIAGNESDVDCVFTQKDNELTGTCSGDKAAIKLAGKSMDRKSFGLTIPNITAVPSP